MKLFRYLATLLFLTCVLSWIALVILVVVANLSESVSQLASESLSTTLAVGVYQAIIYSYQLLPLSVLLGFLAFGAYLARRGELIGFYGAGFSILQLYAICAGPLVLLGIGHFLLGEMTVPLAYQRLDHLASGQFRVMDSMSRLYQRLHWTRQDQAFFYLPHFDSE